MTFQPYKAMAISTPVSLFFVVKGAMSQEYETVLFPLFMLLMGLISIKVWINDYHKQKYLKSAIDWL
jgi:hypothetical protein